MLINLKETRSGDKLRFPLSKDHLDIYDLVGKVECNFTLTKSNKRARLKGNVSYRYTITCARCLERTTLYFSERAEGIFERGTPHISKDKEIELTSKDGETYYYTGDHIDIIPFIRDTILLNMPIKPLCRPDCKGLCPRCGQNLNDGNCKCQN